MHMSWYSSVIPSNINAWSKTVPGLAVNTSWSACLIRSVGPGPWSRSTNRTLNRNSWLCWVDMCVFNLIMIIFDNLHLLIKQNIPTLPLKFKGAKLHHNSVPSPFLFNLFKAAILGPSIIQILTVTGRANDTYCIFNCNLAAPNWFWKLVFVGLCRCQYF